MLPDENAAMRSESQPKHVAVLKISALKPLPAGNG
jgi:hypothetical protein